MMRELKIGSHLPFGQLVYAFHSYDAVSYNIENFYLSQTKGNVMSLDSMIYEFGNDGLWATPWTREIWAKRMCLHPHCTLFGILYKKLGI